MAFDARELAKTARILDDSDAPNDNPALQALVGDPDDSRISTFAQFEPNPGHNQIANPFSPLGGDEIFFAYMIPGAAFQAHDGSQWNIIDYPWQNFVTVENRWYPRLQGRVNLNDVRRSIEQWIEPIQQYVPAPPPGVDYGAHQTVDTVYPDTGTVSDSNGGW
jgi:hypothetical protein